MVFTCVELEAFTRELLRVADEEVLREFQLALAVRPEAGDLIRHSGGLRKARMKLSGRGKSGGARVIYLWLPRARRFIFFMLYTKSTKANIAPEDLARLRAAVETIKHQYNRGKTPKSHSTSMNSWAAWSVLLRERSGRGSAA